MEISYNPASSATTSAEFYSDLQRTTLRERQNQGTAPDTLGVTVPLPPARDIHEFMDELSRWRKSVVQKKGPMGYDTATTPFESSYLQRRYDFISGNEAVRKYAYDDVTGKTVNDETPVKGNVTVGVGFNMERPDAASVFERVLGLGADTFSAVKSGKRPLSDVEIRKLADYTMNEAEKVISSKLKGVDLPEHERLALVSLAFNSPALIGPKLTAALSSGDRKAALEEILYNSNRSKNRGIANRRYLEGKMFAGLEGDMPTLTSYLASVLPPTKVASL